MESHHKALAILSSGLVVLVGGLFLPGNPQAPFGSGGIPRPFYTGVAAGYIVAGGIAYLVGRGARVPTFERLLRASLLAIPLAFVLSVSTSDVGVPDVPTYLAFHLGIAFLFYPVPFGLAFGFGSDERDRTTVWLVSLLSLALVVLLLVFDPGGGPGAVALSLALIAIVVVDVAFAYPLYRLGRDLGTEAAPR